MTRTIVAPITVPIATAVALSVGGTIHGVPQEVTPAKPVTIVEPVYPEAARAHAIDGIAGFRATINPDGTVRDVTVMTVPRPQLGFEAAVEDAVRRWRFQPASANGTNVLGTYVGQVRFVLPQGLKGELMYPRSSRDVWRAAQTVLGQHRFAAERRDDRYQLFVTRWQPYSIRDLPPASDLGLTEPFVPSQFQLHVYVAPGLEPARVAVGSIVSADTRLSIEPVSKKLSTAVFSPDALNAWFVTRLNTALGTTPESLATDVARRSGQSRRLMPRGLTSACATDPPVPGGGGPVELTQPKKIFDFKPPYPGRAVLSSEQATVELEAELTEHGTIVRPVPMMGDGEFRTAAQQAVLLWRFDPPRIGGCGVPARMRVKVEFKM